MSTVLSRIREFFYGPEPTRYRCPICDAGQEKLMPHSDLCFTCYWRIMRIIEERRRRGTHDK